MLDKLLRSLITKDFLAVETESLLNTPTRKAVADVVVMIAEGMIDVVTTVTVAESQEKPSEEAETTETVVEEAVEKTVVSHVAREAEDHRMVTSASNASKQDIGKQSLIDGRWK